MGCLLVSKMVTFNDLERQMAVSSRDFTEFCSFGDNYIKVVKVRPKLSVTTM